MRARRTVPNRDIIRALGYEAGSKLLIVHADDLGLSRSVNRAILEALTQGYITSASVMAPCREVRHVDWPGVSERFDIGIHITFTSEYAACRWSPISPVAETPSLVDADGCFWSTAAAFARSAKRDEIEIEMQAQIEFAMTCGMRPTHLDVHMFALYADAGLCRLMKRTSEKFDLPWLSVRPDIRPEFRTVASVIQDSEIVLDQLIMATPDVPLDELTGWYVKGLRSLRPGVTQLIVHPGVADSELQQITAGHAAYGARWRERDFEAVSAPQFRNVLRDENIRLVNWVELHCAARKVQRVS